MAKKPEDEELELEETGLLEDPDDTETTVMMDLLEDPKNGVPQDEPKTEEKEPEDKKQSEPEHKAKADAKPDELTKTQQMVQQERANARRAREQVERLEQDQAEVKGQLQQAQSELAALKLALTDKKEERKKLDPESVTSKELIDEIEDLRKQIEERKTAESALKAELADAKKAREESAKADAQLSLQDRILNGVERVLTKTIGGSWDQYRVNAIKEADRRVESGEVDRPRTVEQGEDLMLDCYKAVAKDLEDKQPATPPKKVPVRSDTGRSGVSVSRNEIKSGSLASVKDQLAKKPSLWRKSG